MLDAAGRVVMVSGASRGIGAAVVARLIADGFSVSAGMRAPSPSAHENLLVHRYDATEAGTEDAWVAATVARFGRVDALVNAAGIVGPWTLDMADETVLDRLWAVNVKGPLRLTRAAWPHLEAAGHGRVVNIASLSGKRVKNDNVGYAMSKFALVAATHGMRRKGWDKGIRATAVCPSFVATDMAQIAAMAGRIDLTKVTQPEDLADLVAPLLLLPDTMVVAELLVNCRLEDTL